MDTYFDLYTKEIQKNLDLSFKIGYAEGSLRAVRMLLTNDYQRDKILKAVESGIESLERKGKC